MSNTIIIGLVFGVSLLATFGVVLFGRLKSMKDTSDKDLAGRSLNRWLIGLSAAATGNSGFIVTGAVGLGYAGGIQWVMLPIAWLLGDLIFWSLFPSRLNKVAKSSMATTLSELLAYGLSGPTAKAVKILTSIVLVVFLCIYTSAQWIAGQKFLSVAFQLEEFVGLIFFSLTIVVYSALGGFRGSVYADVLQALLSIMGTVFAITSVTWLAFENGASFLTNIDRAGPEFLEIWPANTFMAALGFFGGYACAALGFGLGQPQIASRYFAGSSPAETHSAKWIYISFLQFTWISMTIFGVVLRGVMPDLDDPETGLSVFFYTNMHPILVGLIFAYVYAIIASTANSIVVAVAQSVHRDIFGRSGKETTTPFITTFGVGITTIVLSFLVPGSVFGIAIGAVSKVGAAIAGPVIIKVMGWNHTALSLLLAISSGIAAAFAWEYLGFNSTFNEAGVGIGVSLIVNKVTAALSFRNKPNSSDSHTLP